MGATRPADGIDLMQRVALTRLRRFERLAAVAQTSSSPLWRRLAYQAAAAAMRDCLLAGLPAPRQARRGPALGAGAESSPDAPTPARPRAPRLKAPSTGEEVGDLARTTRRSFVLGGAAALTLGLVACVGQLQGSGRTAVETRSVDGFSEVSVGGGALLVLKQTGQESLRVEVDDNLLPLVETELRDGRLSLGFKPGSGVTTARGLRFELTARELRAIAASGGARVEATGIDTPALRVDVSGGGQVRAAGQAAHQEVTASGGGQYDGAHLATRTARVDVSGGGWAVVDVADELDASASGGGWVEYGGNPRLSEETSGGGAVRRR
jgi:hypothetical protein